MYVNKTNGEKMKPVKLTFDLQNEQFDYTKINTLINNLDTPITKAEISKTIGVFNKNNKQNINLSMFIETEKETMIELTIR
jgi:Ca2+-binding EF-hand superfamily protein